MKRIILCADDYGQNPAISQAIINLIDKKRLSATSCMTTAPDWPEHAKWLLPYQTDIDVGLHINFTEKNRITMNQSLWSLLLNSYLGRLNKTDIEKSIHIQLDLFESSMGRLPDFLDGHQHIHQFPIIRDALLCVYNARLKKTKCYIRSIYRLENIYYFSKNAYIKKLVLQLTGASKLRRELLKRHIPHNLSFMGIYDFKGDVRQKFIEFLQQTQNGGLMMCHPGLVEPVDDRDVISKARYREYTYLNGDDFITDCAANYVNLSRFCAML